MLNSKTMRHSEPAGDRVSPKALAVAQESRELVLPTCYIFY